LHKTNFNKKARTLTALLFNSSIFTR